MDDRLELQRGRRLEDLEQQMRDRAPDDIATLAVLDRATLTLAVMLEGLNVPFHESPVPIAIYLQSAVLNLGILSMRTARALRLVVSFGYEPEADGLKRRLSEAHARIGAIVDDSSGEHARQWLTGKGPSTPQKVAGKFGSLGLFKVYSESTHATMTGLLTWVAVPMPDGTQSMTFAPMRSPEFANALLTEAAFECRDLAMIVGKAFGRDVPELEQLDEDLLVAYERWYAADEPH